MIPRDSHRPCFMTAMQIAEEPSCIFHIAPRIEHRLNGTEMLPVEVLIDLHAAHIDQDRAAVPGALEGLQRFLKSFKVVGLAFDIHRVGLQASLAPRLRQTDGIKDALRNAEFGCGCTDCALTVP